MITFITLVAILQSFAISLGVGSSTLAIVNFFVAIKDGKIDETERRMMGVVYVVLRIAMVLILLTTVIVFSANSTSGLTAFSIGQLVVILVLFTNALLMTAHLMPSTFGPAIQAGNWYTLGTLSAIAPLGLTDFTLTQFFMAYITWIVLAVSLVNGVMAILKAKHWGLLK